MIFLEGGGDQWRKFKPSDPRRAGGSMPNAAQSILIGKLLVLAVKHSSETETSDG